MLQDIRQNIQGTIAKIIIGLIVVSFAIFGIETLLFQPATNAVAEVNGDEVTPFDLQREVAVMQRQILSMLGEDADPSILDADALSSQALQSLVQRTVVSQAAQEMDLTVSDQILGQVIGSMEEFQVGGEFSVDLYQSTLAAAGFTAASFRERLTDDLLQSQLRGGLAGSTFVTSSELAAAARVSTEGRDLRYIALPLAQYRADAAITEDDISEFYAANPERFRSPESVDVEYFMLELGDYRAPIDEDRLREEFELVRSDYEQAEESRVSHILFESDGAARLAEAQAAIDGGMSFADAAQEYSDDIGSASLGGDLGYTAGDAFPEEMEAAIAALAPGETGSVETDAGTHLLLVTDRRAGTAVQFEDVRLGLEERLQTADASAALLEDVERVRDIAFNAADLSEPAEAVGAEIQVAEKVTRDNGGAALSDPRLLRAAFSEEVYEAGHNSEVIELSPERFAVLRVARRNAPQPQPLEAVRAEIEAELRDTAALSAARAEAERMLAELEAGATVEALANAAGLEWQVEIGARRDTPRLAPALRQRAFALAAPAEGQVVRDVVGAGDTLYVLELYRVTQGDLERLTPSEQLALRQQLSSEEANVLLRQYEAALSESAEIRIY